MVKIIIEEEDAILIVGDVLSNIWVMNGQEFPYRFDIMAKQFLDELVKYQERAKDMKKKKWSRQD